MHLEGSRGHCYNHPLLQTSSVELPDKPILLIPKNPLVYTVTLSTTHPVAAWLQHNTRACTSKGHSSTYGGSLVCLLSHRLHTLSPLSPLLRESQLFQELNCQEPRQRPNVCFPSVSNYVEASQSLGPAHPSGWQGIGIKLYFLKKSVHNVGMGTC